MRELFRWIGAVTLAFGPVCVASPALARQKPAALVPAAPYAWKPVRIGAGGFVTGFVTHPLDANVRYCRTDVGNAYRWDAAQSLWLPMKVYNVDGSGVPAFAASAPSPGGVNSIAVDPSNTNIVFMAFPTYHSNDVGGGTNVNIYKSVDGGKNFTAANLNLSGDPNGRWRTYGERLMVDPNNGSIVYYGSDSNGLYRSADGGATFAAVTASGTPATNANVIGVRFYKGGGVSSVSVQSVSSVVYALVGNGDVYRSADGGQTWTNITNGTTAATGKGISGAVGVSAVDQLNGTLYVGQNGSSNLWKYGSVGGWTTIANVNAQPVNGIAIDPTNSNRIFVAGSGSSLSRTTDGGLHWTKFSGLNFDNTLGWLPQTTGANTSRSEAGLYFDKNETLWLPQGNEGVLRYTPTAGNTETSAKFTIDSAGIEEFVTHDVIIPKGGGDKAIIAVEDATGLVITDPDTFTAKQIRLQTQLISNGNGVAAVPNDSSGLFVSTSDINYTGYPNPGQNFSGSSFNGGATWNRFGSIPTYVNSNGQTQFMQTGSIAASVRGGWGAGSDHLVSLPNYSFAPQYSKDGGATWQQTASFPLTSDGHTLDNSKGFQGYWNLSLKQRMLYADPFVPDKFYLKFNSAPSGLYVSTDGGVNWSVYSQNGVPVSGLPNYVYHGQLAVNYNLQDDLWFAYGWEGNAGPGLYHHAPGSATFARFSAIKFAITLALGAGRGLPGDASYTAYFYGKLTTDPAWGIFRSTDAGATWQRIAYYPTGIYDQPTCMAASWDTFGLVYVGFGGNSFVYGVPVPTATGTVALEGVSDLSKIKAAVAPLGTFHISFRNPGTTPEVYGQDVTLTTTAGSAKGSYIVTGVPAGTYDVAIKGAKNLRVLVSNITVSAASGTISDVTLPVGDANNDNSVDVLDFGILVNAYGTDSAQNNGYDPSADFNYDGVVDVLDFGLLVNEYGVVGAN